VTDDASSPSPAGDESATEQPTVVTPGTSAPPAGAPPAGAAPAAGVTETRPPVPPPVPPVVETGPAPGPSMPDKVAALVDERPEIGAGAAFAGGIVFALILKRLGR
jgi:hypothetical protein